VKVNIYNRKRRWKFLLFIVAIIIGSSSLFYTNYLMKNLSKEERKRVELWAKANKEIQTATEEQDISFMFHVLLSNTTIPVLLTDNQDKIISYRNLDSTKMGNIHYQEKILRNMKKKHEPIIIELLNGKRNFIYYNDSTLLTQLQYYPFVQLTIIALFIIVSYLAFSSSRKSEQNHVWLGMSKETAHQLGTPISSLMGWIEVLKLENPNNSIISEIENDVTRLERVAERFSKIGSKPSLSPTNISEAVKSSLSYIQNRSSKKVQFKFDISELAEPVFIPLNQNLFAWVIENICKNAIDAINGEGKIQIKLIEENQKIIIDITDSGKGIPKSRHKTIFEPGYTTKDRGWGLGLSLSRRIIEEYHNGKIFVKFSDHKTGTCIRIQLNKSV
jgi:nitrogen-specific signal transduction histidine kinase